MHKWRLTESPECDCAVQRRAVDAHLILDCRLRRYDSDLGDFIKVMPDAETVAKFDCIYEFDLTTKYEHSQNKILRNFFR